MTERHAPRQPTVGLCPQCGDQGIENEKNDENKVIDITTNNTIIT